MVWTMVAQGKKRCSTLRSPDRCVRSLQTVSEGSVLRVGEQVVSVSLQGRELPDQRREIVGCVPGYVLRVLRSHLRSEHPIPDCCHTVTRALPARNPRRVEKGTTPD